MPPILPRASLVLLLLVTLAGCRTGRPAEPGPAPSGFPARGDDPLTRTRYAPEATAFYLTDRDESLPVYDGRTGEPITGRRLHALLAEAEVILLGEVHDDALAHRLQRRLAREALATSDGGALSLEMLDREDAGAVADLNAADPTPTEVEAALGQTRLADWPGWRRFYLPTARAAVAMDRPLVAANAPRGVADAARTRGFDFLRGLNDAQQKLFALPDDPDAYPLYRARFEAAMVGHTGVDAAPADAPADDAGRMSAHQLTAPATRPSVSVAGRRADASTPAGYYRAQLVWDATMARSVRAALAATGRPVVHLVGNFHSDFDGGLTRMLSGTYYTPAARAALDGADYGERINVPFEQIRVLTVSFVPAAADRLRPQDEGRADVVVYTGEPEQFPRLTDDDASDRDRAEVPATRPSALLFRNEPATLPALQ